MRKIPTLFKRDPEDMRRVLPEVTPGCEWVLAGEGTPTRKYDGTCVMLDDEGCWWARREVKPGKQEPPNFQAIEHDENTGKTVGWEPIGQSAFAKWHALALTTESDLVPGTYELVGAKVNGNPEKIDGHELILHDEATFFPDAPRDFEGLRTWLLLHDFEGVVWHHPDGRMAKLKVRDFPKPSVVSSGRPGTWEEEA